jgi:hypothetical protein
MKLLLIILGSILLSFNHSSYALVDPDSINPSMPVVTYLIPANNLKIAAYRLGSPSKLTVKLCSQCSEKTYDLAPTAKFRLLQQHLEKEKLTEVLLRNEHPMLRLAVHRNKGMITFLHIGVMEHEEFVPILAPATNKDSTEGAIQ